MASVPNLGDTRARTHMHTPSLQEWVPEKAGHQHFRIGRVVGSHLVQPSLLQMLFLEAPDTQAFGFIQPLFFSKPKALSPLMISTLQAGREG